MIKFVAKTLPRSVVNGHDFNEIYNRQAIDFAEYCTQANKNSKCEFHPDSINIVTVVANPKGFTTEKTHFCCPEFAARFTFDNSKKE